MNRINPNPVDHHDYLARYFYFGNPFAVNALEAKRYFIGFYIRSLGERSGTMRAVYYEHICFN